MSQKNIQADEQHRGSPNTPQPLLPGLRKATDSTIEMAQYLKDQELKATTSQHEEEQYDEEEYHQLSSGVYQVSRKSEEPEEEAEEDREYFSQEVRIGLEATEKQKELGGLNHSKQNDSIVKKDQQEQIYVSEGQSDKATPTKLQQLRQQAQKETKAKMSQQMQLDYPSLTLQKPIQLKKGSSSQYEPVFKKENSEEQMEIMRSEEVNGCSENEVLKESDDCQVERLAQKVKQELMKQKLKEQQSKIIKEAEDQELIELQRNEQKPQPVHNSQLIPFIRPNRLEEIPLEESQYQPKVKKLVEAPSKPFLRIIGYEKEYFLKIETQVYQIEYVSANKSYLFCRRFSDFVILNKMVRQQYFGYILYPFPENNLQFFKRVKLSVGSQLQKVVIIQQRLLELQKYLNCLISHREISSGQIFQIFISESKELFTKQFPVLQQVLDKADQQYNSSMLRQNYNHLKNIVKSGINFFSNYITSSSTHQNGTLMLEIQRKADQLLKTYLDISGQLLKDIQICSNFEIKVLKLIEIYQYNKNLKPIQSNIDSVLKFCSKTASSKAYYEQYEVWLEDHLLREVRYFVRLFAEIQQMLDYRKGLLVRVGVLDVEEVRLGVALIEKAEQFDGRFLEDWPQAHNIFSKSYEKMVQAYRLKWQQHCTLMSKIWK